MLLLPERLHGKKIVVCVGPGGVGKTTVAAALAIALAQSGQRTLVVTIDPARRLATSLGLTTLANDPVRIDHPAVGAPFDALMLDMKRTWDDLVTRYAPTDEKRSMILGNTFYQYMSTALSGSLEYVAVEKLYEVADSGRYDVVVLDTPPAAQALDFLSAPDRMVRVLDSQAVKFLTLPFRNREAKGKERESGGGFWNFTDAMVLKRLTALTGVDMLRSISEFLFAFEGMYDGFAERSRHVQKLLRGPETSFLAVTAPRDGAASETAQLVDSLRRTSIPFGGFIVNRVTQREVLPWGGEAPGEAATPFLRTAQALAASVGAGPADPVLARDLELVLRSEFDRRLAIADRDTARLSELRDKAFGDGSKLAAITPRPGLYALPQYPEPVHDVTRLLQVATDLWAARDVA